MKNSLLGEGVKKLSNQFPDPKIVDKSSLKDIISGLSTVRLKKKCMDLKFGYLQKLQELALDIYG